MGNKAVGNLIRDNKTFQIKLDPADRRLAGHVPARQLALAELVNPESDHSRRSACGTARTRSASPTPERRIDRDGPDARAFPLPAGQQGVRPSPRRRPRASHPRPRRPGAGRRVAGARPRGPLRPPPARSPPRPSGRSTSGAGDLDFAYGLEGIARFRANYLRQENGAAAVFRIIPEEIVPLEDLRLPKAIETLAHLQQGLVLVTGPTGSGKSTTLAAMIDRHQQHLSKAHRDDRGPGRVRPPRTKSPFFPNARWGVDTESFGAALRAAIRQDADVILVGEMRDLETISLAVTAAEMGALVFRHAPHQRRRQHDQPPDRRLPRRGAGADPHHPRRVGRRHRLAASCSRPPTARGAARSTKSFSRPRACRTSSVKATLR